MSHADPFSRIVGEQLSAVSLVQDYVKFHFDGPVIRAIANPIVNDGTGTVVFPEPGSRDRLCGLIAHDVVRVQLLQGVELQIELAGGGTITIPLDSRRCPWPEAMHFQESLTAPVQVWNAEQSSWGAA